MKLTSLGILITGCTELHLPSEADVAEVSLECAYALNLITSQFKIKNLYIKKKKRVWVNVLNIECNVSYEKSELLHLHKDVT